MLRSGTRDPLCFPVAKARHRVAIQTLTRTPDGQGGSASSWTTDATVWAAIEPLTGMERYVANQTERSVTHRVTIRYRSGVAANQRILFGDRPLNITAVINPEERDVMLVLECVESTPDTTDG